MSSVGNGAAGLSLRLWHWEVVHGEPRHSSIESHSGKHVMITGMEVRGYIIIVCDGWSESCS